MSRLAALLRQNRVFLCLLLGMGLIRTAVADYNPVPSGSMHPTILEGDVVLVNRLAYNLKVPLTDIIVTRLADPQRGDIVTFASPKDGTRLIKRIVGLPGDTVEMREGLVYIDGRVLEEPYVEHTDPNSDPGAEEFAWQRPFLVRTAEASTHPSRNNWGPLVVPEKNYFVLGDNRDNSADSRYWGFVPDSLVRGRPMFVYYSYEPDAMRRFPWITKIRWNRIGKAVR